MGDLTCALWLCRYVVVYSSNIEGWHGAAHVLHRDVVTYVKNNFPGWKLVGSLQNDYASRYDERLILFASRVGSGCSTTIPLPEFHCIHAFLMVLHTTA